VENLVRSLSDIVPPSKMSVGKGVALGMIILLVAAYSTGFFTLKPNQFAVIVEYKPSEFLKGGLEDIPTHIITSVYEIHPGGKIRIVTSRSKPILETPLGRLYWRLPWPLGIHHVVSLEEHPYTLRFPMIFVANFTIEYLILTDKGFEYFDLDDLYHYRPKVKVLTVKGGFRIVDLELYAVLDKYGFGDEEIHNVLTHIFINHTLTRIEEIRSELEEEHPGFNEPEIIQLLAKRILRDPESLTEGLREQISKLEVERRAGIELLSEVSVDMEEEDALGYFRVRRGY